LSNAIKPATAFGASRDISLTRPQVPQDRRSNQAPSPNAPVDDRQIPSERIALAIEVVKEIDRRRLGSIAHRPASSQALAMGQKPPLRNVELPLALAASVSFGHETE
jgi:hypothetical protein